MKYVTMFHYDEESLGHIETHETLVRPEIFPGDFITIEKGERYCVNSVQFNHEIYVDKVYVYILVRELTEEEISFIDSFVG